MKRSATKTLTVIFILVLISVGAVLLVSSSHPRPSSIGDTSSRTLIFIRHAEKPEDATDLNITQAGRRRALCVASKIQIPQTIYVAYDKGKSKRSLQTGAIISCRLKELYDIDVPVVSYKRDKWMKMLKAIPKDGLFLVVWEHSVLVDIVKYLNPVEKVPKIKSDEFDKMYVVSASGKRVHLEVKDQGCDDADDENSACSI